MNIVSWGKKRNQLVRRLSDSHTAAEMPNLREKWEGQQLLLQAERDELLTTMSPIDGLIQEDASEPMAHQPAPPGQEEPRAIESAKAVAKPSLASYLDD